MRRVSPGACPSTLGSLYREGTVDIASPRGPLRARGEGGYEYAETEWTVCHPPEPAKQAKQEA